MLKVISQRCQTLLEHKVSRDLLGQPIEMGEVETVAKNLNDIVIVQAVSGADGGGVATMTSE